METNYLVLKEVFKFLLIFIIIGQATINELRLRFIPRPNMKTKDYIKHVDMLIEQSVDNWRTKWYDKYQYMVQGIFY